MKKKRNKFQQFLEAAENKLADVLTHKVVVKTSRIASSVLEVASKLGQSEMKGPLAWAGAGLSAVDVVRGALDIRKKDLVQEYLDNETDDFLTKDSFLGDLLVQTGALQSLKYEVVVESTDYGRKLISIDDQNGKSLLLVVYEGSGKTSTMDEEGKSGPKKASTEAIEREINFEEGFDFSCLSLGVWDLYETKALKLVSMGWFAKLEPLPDLQTEYVGVHDPKKFAEEVEIYKKQKVSRSFLLHGSPGSGKTTFVRAYCNLIKGRLLVIPPDTLNRNVRDEVSIFLQLLRPDVLLVDDVDHAPKGLTASLTMFTDFRSKYPEMVLITTANDLSKVKPALLRPGRLGGMIEFKAPDDADKTALLDLYFKHYEVDPSALNIPQLVSKMQHPRFTADYVRYVAENAIMMNQERLEQCIDEINLFLEKSDEWDEDFAPSDKVDDDDDGDD